jgi:hypothetical protein
MLKSASETEKDKDNDHVDNQTPWEGHAGLLLAPQLANSREGEIMGSYEESSDPADGNRDVASVGCEEWTMVARGEESVGSPVMTEPGDEARERRREEEGDSSSGDEGGEVQDDEQDMLALDPRCGETSIAAPATLRGSTSPESCATAAADMAAVAAAEARARNQAREAGLAAPGRLGRVLMYDRATGRFTGHANLACGAPPGMALQVDIGGGRLAPYSAWLAASRQQLRNRTRGASRASQNPLSQRCNVSLLAS